MPKMGVDFGGEKVIFKTRDPPVPTIVMKKLKIIPNSYALFFSKNITDLLRDFYCQMPEGH